MDYLTQLGNSYSKQSQVGLDPKYKALLSSQAYGNIDRRFDEAGRTSRNSLASAGLTASGLGSVAGAKLAGQRANAIQGVDANMAQMDWEARQQGLQGLMGVQGGYQHQADQAQQQRQFQQQLDFQKEEAEYGWGDFFGDVAGFGGQVLGGWAISGFK